MHTHRKAFLNTTWHLNNSQGLSWTIFAVWWATVHGAEMVHLVFIFSWALRPGILGCPDSSLHPLVLPQAEIAPMALNSPHHQHLFFENLKMILQFLLSSLLSALLLAAHLAAHHISILLKSKQAPSVLFLPRLGSNWAQIIYDKSPHNLAHFT